MPLFGFAVFAFFGFLGIFDLAFAGLYPSFVLEVATAPSVFDTDVSFTDFALEPLVEYLLLLGGLVHILDLLVVVAEVGRMGIYAIGQSDDGHDVSVALRLLHDEGLGHFAGFEVSDFASHFLRQFGHLEACSAGVLVDHYAVAVTGILVLRYESCGVFKCHAAFVHDVAAETVEARDGILKVLVGHLGTQQNVARIDSVAALFDELDDVKSEFGFDNLGDFLGVIEVESYSCVFGHQLASAQKSEFAAAHAFGCLAVENGECREVCFATVDAVGHIAQTCFDIVYFLARNHRVDCNNLDFDLPGDVGYRVFGQVVKVFAHLAGCGFDVFGEILLHHVHTLAVADAVGIVFAYLGYGFAEILLDFFARTEVVNQEIELLIYLQLNLRILYDNRIDVCLMQVEALDGHHLGYDAVRVAVDGFAILLHIAICLLDFGLVYGVIADGPCHFFGNIVLGYGNGCYGCYGCADE